jgi:membrane protease YdiL (CAAX protease family)
MNKKKTITFILISYGFSWLIWGRQVLNHNFDLGWTISPWNHLIGGLGPFVGAILTTLLFEKREGLANYFKEKLFTFPPLKWVLLGIGMPVVFFLLPYLFLGLFQDEWADLTTIGLNSKVPIAHTWVIWLMWCVFYGLGEEAGWRGFLFPEFCKSYKARIATLYTAFVWAPWHLPIFFYDKDFQTMGLAGTIGWGRGTGLWLLAFGLAGQAGKMESVARDLVAWHLQPVHHQRFDQSPLPGNHERTGDCGRTLDRKKIRRGSGLEHGREQGLNGEIPRDIPRLEVY